MVCHQSLVYTPSSPGEFWGVQNHCFELFALFDQPVERLKSVAAFEPDTCETVDVSVADCLSDGAFAAVDAQHFRRSSEGGGGEGEAAGVAKHVENAAAPEVFGGGESVFALVQVHARF